MADGDKSDRDRAVQPRRKGAVRETIEASEFGLAREENT